MSLAELKEENNKLLLKETQTHNENVSLKSKIEGLEERTELLSTIARMVTEVSEKKDERNGELFEKVIEGIEENTELKVKIMKLEQFPEVALASVLAVKENEIEELKEEIKESGGQWAACVAEKDKRIDELQENLQKSKNHREHRLHNKLKKEIEELKEGGLKALSVASIQVDLMKKLKEENKKLKEEIKELKKTL